jgi:hypothetical protein
MSPAIRPCKCGATPKFLTCHDGPDVLLQLACACGQKGAPLTCTRPEDRARVEQAAVDGWNMAT